MATRLPQPTARTAPRALLLCALLAAAGQAAAVSRCESRDGRVAYTDAACPAGMKLVRRVDDSAPVQVHDARDAQDATRPATASDAAVDAAPRSRAAGPAAAGGLQPAKPTVAADPEREIRRLDEARARQQARCADLGRRLDYAASDLRAAPAGERASAELALRRLQEEARATCPPAARTIAPADSARPLTL